MIDVDIVETLARQLGIFLPRRDPGNIDPWTQSPGYTVDQFDNLIDLNLYGIGIHEFPLMVLDLTKLKLLDLGANKLTELPEGIDSLADLETLNLGNNSLTSLPPGVGRLRSLRSLILWGNQLTRLPREMANLDNIEVFNTFNNPIEYPPEEVLLKGFDCIRNFLRETSPDEFQSHSLMTRTVARNDGKGSHFGKHTPSTRKIPLVRFNGFLKQIIRDDVGPIAQLVLDKAFPMFWSADPSTEDWKRRRDLFKNANYVFDDVDAPRRLAGCWGLPKRRYHSICVNETGSDENTLVNELNAYLDPLRGGLVLFGDMAMPQTAVILHSQFGISAAQGPYLLMLFVGWPGAISPVISALEENGLVKTIGDQAKERVLVGVEVPYAVRHHFIDDVCDLRLPDCQEYVVEEFFKKDTSSLEKIDRIGIQRFVDTLPILMHPALGGGAQSEDNGAILQALAAFLRINGAKALVFPSARSDVLVEVKARKLVKWRGWCLVDYRDAPPPIIKGCFDMSEGWPRIFPKGATVRVADNDEYRGSFEVSGIVAWGRERVGEIEAHFIAGQRDC